MRGKARDIIQDPRQGKLEDPDKITSLNLLEEGKKDFLAKVVSTIIATTSQDLTGKVRDMRHQTDNQGMKIGPVRNHTQDLYQEKERYQATKRRQDLPEEWRKVTTAKVDQPAGQDLMKRGKGGFLTVVGPVRIAVRKQHHPLGDKFSCPKFLPLFLASKIAI